MNSSNNSILITLIVFIVLTIGLGVGEYFTAKAMSEAKSTLESNNAELKKIKADNAELASASKKLRNLLGVGYTEDSDAAKLAADITATCDDIASRWSALTGDDSEVPKNCLAIIDMLVRNLEQKNQKIAEANSEREEYRLIADSEVKKSENQQSEFDTSMKTLTDSNDARFQDINSRYDDLNQKGDELAKKVETLSDEAMKVNEDYRTQVADAEESVKYIAGINKELRSKIAELSDPIFEIPDGKIVYVDQSSRVARLNIGESDGVRLLTTFGVFPADSLEKGVIKSKGSLEVIRIVGEHESEARILDDEMENPLTPGDLIYTPLWKIGTEVNIALDYFLDVDGDHKDDLSLLINIIKSSGANVSAFIGPDGEIQGKVSADVTYLITSNTPIEEVLEADIDSSDELKKKISKAHTKLEEDANFYSVRKMKLSEFLRRTHYKQSAEVSRYQEPGEAAKPDRTGAPVVSDAAVAPIFDERTKDARNTSFGLTAPVYDSGHSKASSNKDTPPNSSGKVSDTYFRKRAPKDL